MGWRWSQGGVLIQLPGGPGNEPQISGGLRARIWNRFGGRAGRGTMAMAAGGGGFRPVELSALQWLCVAVSGRIG